MHNLVDLVARIVLFPVLIVQAIAVRRTAQQLSEPPGPRSGRRGEGRVLRVLIIGDSSAAGVGAGSQETALSGQLSKGLAQQFLVDWRLVAKTGATTRSTIRTLKKQLPRRWDVVVVALGVNDVTRAVPRAIWLRQLGELVDVLEQRFDAKRIYLSGLPPMGQFPLLPHPLRWVLGRQARRLDQGLQTFAENQARCRYLALEVTEDPARMAEDGFHPGPSIYAEWAAQLASAITSDWAARDDFQGKQ